ncbi:DUF2779 domain-containing protein [Novosphingobium sp.]|uniref:DUF2779 domain-containing protein n=1 Tax=Novosphingobium sp. TaxID=1874826 RepID=UPI003BA9AEC1
MTSRRFGLSKSKISLFEQCPKRLWLSVHRPELAEESDRVRASFAAGHVVGEFACRLRPDGIMVDANDGLAAAVEQTSDLLAAGWDRPIFEATFAHDGVLIRADIIEPHDGGWHLAEVKNTTGVKAYHIGDIATQVWVMRSCGIDVRSAAVRHLDRSFMLTREGDYAGLYADTPVLAMVEPIAARRAEVVAQAREMLGGDEPVRELGDHCDDPFTCSFKAYCGRHLPQPPEWPVALLPDAAGKKVARSLLAQGITDLTLAPVGAMTNAKLARVHAATLSAQAYHDAEAVRRETADWAYPRVFLDFETIQFAIPRWIGTSPFTQVPFQFSAHIETAEGVIDHIAFLAADGSDPRRACAEALTALPATGAVIAWNASFERQCLTGLAEQFPDLAPSLQSLADRLVDLLPIARRNYYHRDMRGSWSIKAVLPTLAAIGYEDLVEVKSGTDAQTAYFEAIDPGTTPERAAAIRDALFDYCRRDTEAMVQVLAALTR